ncbi:formylglycine-generating enzyme family protein [Oceanimonas sp. CHS3-5]|uniref:formylglycine-generating enzyme family protein n=1 Tax=Oceanimonas sp. CHS3-5 TaxID=3068186 RepID=UPI00273E6AE2|nr:formylglycine-generating enzyme family protein [Oceanimonas sp. CHS3-5]MDP5291600.1 formylglycine-generating enzyme family protein [Oceanimonas sp. CHS3-5]
MSMALLLSLALPVSVTAMVELPAGEVRPLYLTKDSPLTPVAPFMLDVTPVTNRQFAAFVAAHSAWQPGRPPALFTEPGYLRHWAGMSPSQEQLNQPVTYVSWFAADAYCRAQGKRLPKVAEWEYAAQASATAANGAREPGFTRRILDWYARPATAQLHEVGQSPSNYWQVQDLHGLVWEWTQDFNSALVTGESRGDSSLDQGLFCGSASAGSADPSDYAAFMRYGFRSSLKATYALGNLGFRCAKEINDETPHLVADAAEP